MKRNSVWIMEMWVEGYGWLPTTGCALDRVDGRDEVMDWKTRNPDDKFRLRRYYVD